MSDLLESSTRTSLNENFYDFEAGTYVLTKQLSEIVEMEKVKLYQACTGLDVMENFNPNSDVVFQLSTGDVFEGSHVEGTYVKVMGLKIENDIIPVSGWIKSIENNQPCIRPFSNSKSSPRENIQVTLICKKVYQ